MTMARIMIVLYARRRIVLITLAGTMTLALFVSLLAPKLYRASTSLVLIYKGVDPVSGLAMSPQLMPGYVATQIDIIRSQAVALKVVDQLRLADLPSYTEQFKAASKGDGDIRDRIAKQLVDKITVIPARESSVMEVTYKCSDAQRASDIVNAFAAQYLQTGIQLNTDPLKQGEGGADAPEVMGNLRIQGLKHDLRIALEKKKVLELNRARDQLAVLMKDAESAQRAYDHAIQRFSPTSLEGQANQAGAAVLNPAVPPTDPWFPRLPLNMTAALLLGLALGVGIAFTAEMMWPRIRSGDELAVTFVAPVLAEFRWDPPAGSPALLALPSAIQRMRPVY